MKTNILRLMITALMLVALTVPSYSKGVYILCYHAFLERKDPYSFTNESFSEQLHRLKKSGFKFITFEDIINNKIEGNKNILVSIDDGNKSVYQAYFSIMKPMGIKPLLGIYPAIISRMHYAMTWEEVKKLSDEGCYIASHGYHHMFLSTKYYNQDQISFKKEIYLSKKILEEKLNRKIETMVYPFGVSSDIAVSELTNAGYKYGMNIEPRMDSLPINNNFQITRFLMTKPGQKGVIARIIKSSENSAEAVAVNNNPETGNAMNAEQKNIPGRERLSLLNYPERLKNFITTDVIAIPAKTDSSKKQNVKFKPFVHNSHAVSGSKKKGKKLTAKSEKKNQRKKKAA